MFAAQTSPVWAQNDPFAQKPLLQSLEQQSPCAVHALPVVRQAVFKGAHMPLALQVALQHCAEVVQGWSSDVQCDEPHAPALQTRAQQSSGVVHGLPLARHVAPSEPPAPLAPPDPPVPPVPAVLASNVPPSELVPPAPPVEIPSTSPPPQPALQSAKVKAITALRVSEFLTLCSFEQNPPRACHR